MSCNFLGFFCSICIYVNTLLLVHTSCAITLFILCTMVKTRHLNQPLLERLTLPDQPTRSGTLLDHLTLSDQESAGPYAPLSSLLSRLSKPPQAPARSRTDETGSRPLLKR